MIKKILNRIDQSLYDVKKRISSAKISAYTILILIYLSTFTFLVIDIVNAIVSWREGNLYEIPVQHIGIFTLILAHHLTLLGIERRSDKDKLENNHKESKGNKSGTSNVNRKITKGRGH